MVNDYIPPPDARSHAWQNNFVTYVNGHLVDLGLAPSDVVDVNNSAATWTTDYPAHTATQVARRPTDSARDGFERAICPPTDGVMQYA